MFILYQNNKIIASEKEVDIDSDAEKEVAINYCTTISSILASNHQHISHNPALRFSIDRVVYSTKNPLEELQKNFLREFCVSYEKQHRIYNKRNQIVGLRFPYHIRESKNSIKSIDLINYHYSPYTSIIVHNPSKNLLKFFNSCNFNLSRIELTYDFFCENITIEKLQKLHAAFISNIKRYSDKNKFQFIDGRDDYEIFWDKHPRNKNYQKFNQEDLYKTTFYCGRYNSKEERVNIHNSLNGYRIYVLECSKGRNSYVSKSGKKICQGEKKTGCIRFEVQLNRQGIIKYKIQLPFRKNPTLEQFIQTGESL